MVVFMVFGLTAIPAIRVSTAAGRTDPANKANATSTTATLDNHSATGSGSQASGIKFCSGLGNIVVTLYFGRGRIVLETQGLSCARVTMVVFMVFELKAVPAVSLPQDKLEYQVFTGTYLDQKGAQLGCNSQYLSARLFGRTNTCRLA
jgi:hypothetical protein